MSTGKKISQEKILKQPPQAVEVEKYVLGAMMMERDAYDIASNLITADSFLNEAHKKIFDACFSLGQRGSAIDIITVARFLADKKELDQVGGAYYVTALTNNVTSLVHFESHCLILVDKSIRREMIKISGDTIANCYDESGDVFEMMNDHEKSFTRISTGHFQKKFSKLDGEIAKRLQRIQNLMASQSHITGIESGFRDLDQITHGWQNTDLIILAARPSVGKTALALNLARNAANTGTVGIFSLEMSTGQLTDRFISAESGIWLENIANGRMTENDLNFLYSKALEKISALPIFIDDSAALNSYQVKSRARLLKRKYDLKLLIVDYLQLMSGSNDRRGNREQEISGISRDLKGLAKELNIPIIALSQLSREPEKRKGESKSPQLSDLRECIAIDEWVYTSDGPVQIGSRPKNIITISDNGPISHASSFIEKKFNTVFKVRTQYGQVRGTANHLILTGTGWKKIRDLDIERDVIASAKRIPHANKGPRDHARFLGWMLGNGGFEGTPSLIYRRELDDDVRREIIKFGVQIQYRKTQKSDNVFDTYLSNGKDSGSLPNPVMTWLRYLGLEGHTSYNKFIPDEFMGSSDDTHRELLRGLWETDGTVTRGVAKYATVSEVLARQVGWLLLTLGIRSTINKYDKIWEIRCSKADNASMAQIVNNRQRFGSLKIPDIDYIDPAPSIFVELAAELTQERVVRFQKKVSGEYKSVSKARMTAVLDEFEIDTIQYSPYMTLPDVGWGRIYSIEKEEREVRVCDLHVPGTHNFLIDGIVAHNSGAIEQDADMVVFLYRPEYYDPSAAELGETNKGETHVKIAKHRNGRLDTVKLKANLSIQKFSDWETEAFVSSNNGAGSWRPISSQETKDLF